MYGNSLLLGHYKVPFMRGCPFLGGVLYWRFHRMYHLHALFQRWLCIHPHSPVGGRGEREELVLQLALHWPEAAVVELLPRFWHESYSDHSCAEI